MKKRRLAWTGIIFGTGVICLFLAKQNCALRQQLAELSVQLSERIAQLENVQAESAELKIRLSGQQRAEWEVETLRQQAKDVPRLRGQVSELYRLRQENDQLSHQVSQFTNRLEELAQRNEKLQAQLITGLWAFSPRHGLEADSVTNAPRRSMPDLDGASVPGGIQPNHDLRLPSDHALPTVSCVSCHAGIKLEHQPEVKPQLLGAVVRAHESYERN